MRQESYSCCSLLGATAAAKRNIVVDVIDLFLGVGMVVLWWKQSCLVIVLFHDRHPARLQFATFVAERSGDLWSWDSSSTAARDRSRGGEHSSRILSGFLFRFTPLSASALFIIARLGGIPVNGRHDFPSHPQPSGVVKQSCCRA